MSERPSPEHPTPDYYEPARGYRGLWVLAAIFLVGFGIDLSLDVHGAVTHLPGWLGAAVVLFGMYWLLVRAARATKSLSVDVEHVRIGDNGVDRDAITASSIGHDDELPVLGWPTGLPRGVQGVTLHLVDDRAVVVPTRYPHRLREALGHGAEDVPRDERAVRAATDSDLALLGDVEQRADTVFAVSELFLPEADEVADYTDVDAAAIFVVGTPPIGFVHLTDVDGEAHVRHLAVLPAVMRTGVGTRLLEHAAAWAIEQGYAAITLTTYADVAWNAPFYAGRGFVEVPAETPGLIAIRADERARGFDDIGRRVVMRREL